MFGFRKKTERFQELPRKIQEALTVVTIPGQDPQWCIQTLRKIAKKYPAYYPAQLNLASMLLDQGDSAGARTVYEGVLNKDPGNQGATAGIATVLAAQGDYEQAKQYAKSAIEAGYEWAGCYEVIAKVLEKEGDPEGAANHYLRAYELSPHAWYNLEAVCRIQKRPYYPPTSKNVSNFLTKAQLQELIEYLDTTANHTSEDGTFGCNHTFRFAKKWAQNNDVDFIELYQFLNAHGGFCDCEVCYNVEQSIFEKE